VPGVPPVEKALLVEISKVETFYLGTLQRFEAEFEVLRSQTGGTSKESGRVSSLDASGGKEAGVRQRSLSTAPAEGGVPGPYVQSLRVGSNEDTTSFVSEGGLRLEHQAQGSMAAVDHDLETLHGGNTDREIFAHKSSKRAFVDLYRQMCFLQNYAILNYTAVIKIFKKHDKLLVRRAGEGPDIPIDELCDEEVEARNIKKMSTNAVLGELRRLTAFAEPLALEELMAKHETVYANAFCARSRDVAKAELLMNRNEYSTEFELPFRLGVRIGVCLLLVAWVAWDVIGDFGFIHNNEQTEKFLKCHTSASDYKMVNQTHDSIVDAWFKRDFPVYRGMLSLTLALWMFGCLIFLWNYFRINYLFMLELDPRLTPSMVDTFWAAADVTILILSTFLIQFKVLRCEFPRWPERGSLGIWPIIPFTFIIYKSVFPWAERKQVWTVVRDTVIAPCVEVSFCMNFAGDVLTSLVKPIVDVAYTLCYYFSGDWLGHLGEDGVCLDSSGSFTNVVSPIILIAPYWFRLCQCLRRYSDSGKRHPNLPNAWKYGLSMCVTIFGIFDSTVNTDGNIFRVLWIVTYFSSTLYSWSWDVLMDWSALDLKAPGLLRSRRMLPERSYYYFAIVVDLILRFFWTYTLIPINVTGHFSAYLGLYISPFAAIAEIVRRAMWSVFRLENEHLHNTAGYRKVKHIPLHFDTVPTKSIKPVMPRPRWQIFLEASVFVAVVVVVLVVAIETE
jgi:hypothetical protein